MRRATSQNFIRRAWRDRVRKSKPPRRDRLAPVPWRPHQKFDYLAVAMDARGVRDTIDHVRRLLEETTAGDDLVARGNEVRARLRAALAQVEDAARARRDEAGAAATEARRSAQDELADAERRIRENPLGAVLVAAGLGLTVGLLVRRR
jgi:ElaB/YqjD/DUF883 family membrane-anchored ribosome-binding protein